MGSASFAFTFGGVSSGFSSTLGSSVNENAGFFVSLDDFGSASSLLFAVARPEKLKPSSAGAGFDVSLVGATVDGAWKIGFCFGASTGSTTFAAFPKVSAAATGCSATALISTGFATVGAGANANAAVFFSTGAGAKANATGFAATGDASNVSADGLVSLTFCAASAGFFGVVTTGVTLAIGEIGFGDSAFLIVVTRVAFTRDSMMLWRS